MALNRTGAARVPLYKNPRFAAVIGHQPNFWFADTPTGIFEDGGGPKTRQSIFDNGAGACPL